MLIMTVIHRQRARPVRLGSTRLQMQHPAATVLLDWRTWMVTRQLCAACAQLARMQQAVALAAMFVHLVRLILTRMHRLCVMRVGWESSRLLGLSVAPLVPRAGLTRTLMPRRRAVSVDPVGIQGVATPLVANASLGRQI